MTQKESALRTKSAVKNAIKSDSSIPQQSYGATKEDWTTLQFLWGVGADLLPVVSNPTATISPNSSLGSIGKVPSKYNGRGHATGIVKWTEKQTTDDEIEQWSAQTDYGIAIQTRFIRAIDVDITNQGLSDAISVILENYLGFNYAVRARKDSSKFLVPYRLEDNDPFYKQVVRTNHGIIEFLGNGQQFIAAGLHTSSGTRYDWGEAGIPASVPTITRDKLEELIAELERVYATEPVRKDRASLGPDDITDPLYLALEEKGLLLNRRRDGGFDIECPFYDEHGSVTVASSTTYFPPHTNGFAKSNIKCLHGTCSGRSQRDYEEAVGIFRDINLLPDLSDTSSDSTLSKFVRNTTGAITASMQNLTVFFGDAKLCGRVISFDEFRGEVMASIDGGESWAPFRDSDYTELILTLEDSEFLRPRDDYLQRAVRYTAENNPRDTAQIWLTRLPWDGVERIDTFLPTYLSTEDSQYTRALSRYLWTALAGRVLDPGLKADMTPVLIGEQGCRKSSAVAALVPDPQFFTEINFSDSDADLSRKMRGKLVGELAELRGLNSKDEDHLKAWMTRQHESWVPKYQEFSVSYPRRLVFIGTTNREEFLSDDTGNRRWLPVRVNSGIDTDKITADHVQLWAEARERYKKTGLDFRDAEKLAFQVHRDHLISDPWETTVEHWLENHMSTPADFDPGLTPEYVTYHDILNKGLGIPEGMIDRNKQMRVSRILKKLGWRKVQRRVGSSNCRVYVPPECSNL